MFRRLAKALGNRKTRAEPFGPAPLRAQIGLALTRAAATAPLRVIDPKEPRSWEFYGFSQHGEDGIVDYLCSRLLNPARFFFEIGAANGIENCTAWLAFARSYGGVWVEGNPALCRQARAAIAKTIWNVHVVNRFVDPDSVPALLKMCPFRAPDVFSLDIDGIDYHVASRILKLGCRPKIWVVEYNSVFGPERAVSVPDTPGFDRWAMHHSGLYYGCSIGGWRSLFAAHGYAFVAVEQSGVNAFFIDPAEFPAGFAEGLRGETFRNNDGDFNEATRPYKDAAGDDVLPARDWRAQYERIAALPLVEIR
ncbi:MAG: hypothetical protein ACLPL5_03455 [Stellaceae bacterium]|jgi:hypothetical protein